MSLTQLDKIDTMNLEEGSSNVVLTISDEHDWESHKDHLLILQQKINAYLGFIEHKEYLKSNPEYHGKPFVIKIISKNEYPEIAKEFLQRVQGIIKPTGVKIILKVLG